MTKLRVIDVTLRDGHQSLWATRMTTAMMLPIAERMDRIGFEAIDLVGGAVFDVCVRYLREDPWERMRIMSERVRHTPLIVMSRGASLFTFEFFPDDVVELTMQRIAANGIRYATVYDALNDLRNLEVSISSGRTAGLYVAGGVVYTVSPVHTDAYYAAKARELVKMGADAVFLKDPSGLLTPERTRTLIPVLREAVAATPLQLHSHCLTGLAPICYVDAIRLGIDVVHTAISPLANGASLPATEFVARRARDLHRATELDDDGLDRMREYFSYVARREHQPVGEPAEYDPFHYEHQVPGGMISNLRYQLSTLGIVDKLQEVLEEAARVRQELGYPIIVSPFAQFVVTQAVLNVMQKERYRIVPDEIRKYACGYYGALAAPIDPNVLDRIAPDAEPIMDRPGALMEPRLPGVRAELGPGASEEDVLLSVFYDKTQTAPLFEARPIKREYAGHASPLVTLIRELARRDDLESVRIERPDLKLTQVF